MAPERAMVSSSMGAMNSVLSKLAALSEEGNTKGVTRATRKGVVFLMDELMSMKGLLQRLADTEEHDALVKGWMSQVREMTYDFEDTIDKFVHSVSRPHRPKALSSRLLKTLQKKMEKLAAHNQFAKEIQDLKQRVEETSERRARYKLDDAVTPSNQRAASIEPRLSAPHLDKASLVGIDDWSEKLIKILNDGQRQSKAVAICGHEGLGKTTLAMDVYERLKMQFNCGAVVTVSRNPNIKKTLQRILSQVTARDYGEGRLSILDERQLIDELREILQHKRYFILIDDLWNTQDWSIINFALPENDLGSRVLVTTRIMNTAKSCGHVFRMSPLKENEARKLFFRRIFKPEESCPPGLAEVSDYILKKCCGVPLAIILIAGLLLSTSDAKEVWLRIRGSIGSPFNDFGLETMRKILNLSYIDLPIHLKTCLLYLSMFPENCVIDKKLLVRRWIAEGFISAERGVNIEEVGEHYINELINRGLVQSVDIPYDGQIDACQVHDMIFDFILRKSVEENFVITYSTEYDIFRLQDKARRLFIDCGDGWHTFTPSEITTSHVRSLAIFGSDIPMPSLANFNALRVLDLETYGELGSHYLKIIGRLYLLKYLRLQTPSAIRLPEEIGELQYLETLDLARAPKCELPEGIVRLKRLVHLLVNNAKLPDGFGRMRSLQEVFCVKIDSSNSKISVQEIGDLSALRTLGLYWCISKTDNDVKTYEDILVSSLRKLSTSALRSLNIYTDYLCSLEFLLDYSPISGYHLHEFQMFSMYYFPTVPKWISSLINLNILRINIEIVGEEVLQTLGGLQVLRALKLCAKSTDPERELIIRSNEFKCLEEFYFSCSEGLVMVMFERDAMKKLEKLQVLFGAQGNYVSHGFHLGIEHLSLLKHLAVGITCEGVRTNDVIAIEDAIKNAVSIHPNHPSLKLERLLEENIVGDEREITVHDDEEENPQNKRDIDVAQLAGKEEGSTSIIES